jgi:hypothetical protein
MKLITSFMVIASASATSVTPIQKVVQLLTGMAEQGKKEKHDEQVQFAAYSQFCSDTTGEKANEIEVMKIDIQKFIADSEKNSADAGQLLREVGEINANIAGWEADKKKAMDERTAEKTEYTATHKDYTESIGALEKAVMVLKQQNYNRSQKQAQALLITLKSQLKFSSKVMSSSAMKKVDSYLALAQKRVQEYQPLGDAHGYEFQSSGVIEMLEKLRDKFSDERTELEREEANSRHSNSLLLADLKQQLEAAAGSVSRKTSLAATKKQAAADADSDRADTEATLADTEKYLSDLKSTCAMKHTDFEARQGLRGDEIAAIEKAIEIIGGSAVQGSGEKYLPSMFLQLKSSSRSSVVSTITDVNEKQRVVMYLQTRGSDLKSRVLSTLAMKVSTSQDPLAKVKQLINDLIVKLMEEANEEAEHNGWCSTELATNEKTRTLKQAGVEKLSVRIEEHKADIAKYAEKLAELAEVVQELTTDIAKATKLREEEKSSNEAKIKDSQDAQTALTQAVTVLQEFYAKAGESTALISLEEFNGVRASSVQAPPAVFDSPYQGMQAQNGGVIGLLEVITSDFARLESETTASEAQSAKEHNDFMTDSKVSKAQAETDTEHTHAKKQTAEMAIETAKADLDGTQRELTAALDYFEKLKPSCIETGVSHEERAARRQEEIESLQEALKILNGEDVTAA